MICYCYLMIEFVLLVGPNNFHFPICLTKYFILGFYPLIFKNCPGWSWPCRQNALFTSRKEIWLWSEAGIYLCFFNFIASTYGVDCWLIVHTSPQLRFTGDLLMELGAGVELATAAVPQLFLPLACAANVLKVRKQIYVFGV